MPATTERPVVSDAPRMGEDTAVARDLTPEPADGAGASARGLSVQGTAIVGVGLVVAQLIAMAQMLVVSRLLGPEQFGGFGAMAVILLLGSTAMVATQVVIARHVASGRSSEHVGFGAVLLVGTLAAAGALLLTPLMSRALNLPSALGLVMVALTFVPLTVTGAQLGLLQGAERHARLGALYILATGARVVGAVCGAWFGDTARATVIGLAIGAAAGAVLGLFLLSGQPPWGSREEGPRDFLAEVGHAAHALVALYALTNMDVLLARASLPARDAGIYAAGALIARAVFFLPQAILVAAFPRMVAGASHVQRQALAAVAMLGLAATAIVALLPDLVVAIMSGSQYREVGRYAWLFALTGAGFAVVQVQLYARMAHHDRRATIQLWSGVAVLAALGATLGSSVSALAGCAAAVAWTVAIVGLVWTRTDPPPTSSPDVDEPIVTPTG